MRLRLLAVAVLLIIVASQTVAAPAGQQQYIVKTKHVITPPHAKAAPSVQDIVRAGGGHVDYEWRDRLVVTLPDAAVQALTQHPAVEFVQRVASGIPEGGTAAAESAGPVVTSSAFRPAPKSFPPWTSGTYSYDGHGNITAIGSNTYSYDAFARLATSTTNGIPETYAYDRYGNLIQKVTGTGSTALPVQSPVDDGNHLSAHCYDKAGNLTDDDPIHCPAATETYSYDALNRMTMKWNRVAHTKEYYIYNANDERIAVIPCSETACTEQITFSFRDESGKVLRQFEVPYQQFDSPWTWVEDYVYRDGVLLAAERVPAQGGRRYFHTDHLGTPRLITDSSGRRISEHDYFPFGVEATPLRQDTLPVNGFNREEPMKFTGHERDFTGGTSAENSNYIDYMHARSTVPQWGRFLSVDPVLNVKRAMASPQAWNRYAYALNNPLNYTDPTGRDVSIGITFKGDGWTDEMKKAVIGRVTQFYTGLHIGNAYVFDSAKAKHSSFFAWKSRGYADITADAGLTKGQHQPGLVRAGVFLQDASLSLAQKANAIANTIDHETLAHQFGATYDNIFDFAHYNRDLQFAKQYPELSQYFGTVADSHIANDPQYRGRLFSGPLPVHPHDLGVAQELLSPHHIDPPEPNQ